MNEMNKTTRQEARRWAHKCLESLAAGEEEAALEALNPLITAKTPLPILDLVGKILMVDPIASSLRLFRQEYEARIH